jgi:hypothetical protein
MIPAKQAHRLSEAKHDLVTQAHVITDLANVERRVMAAVERGEFHATMPTDQLVSAVMEVLEALNEAGYSVDFRRRRKGNEESISIAWGDAGG